MNKKIFFSFFCVVILLITLFIISVNTGSVEVSYCELFSSIFNEPTDDVQIIFDLRLPRIIIAIFAGASLAVSGVLFQAVLKNPLADSGILGISSAANFVNSLIIGFFPSLFLFSPIFAFVGGVIACVIVYSLSYKGGFSAIRIILVGVAVNSVFSGLSSVLNSMNGQQYMSSSDVNISMKTWDDVILLVIYSIVGLILAMFIAKKCNLMALEDKTIRGIGVNVNLLRVIVSFIAVLLAAITTAVAGSISFIGLIVPHIGRLIVGYEHKILIPFSILLGAVVLLFADTLGRVIAYPYEISPAIIMAIIGGPFFIILLKRGGSTYGS